MSDQGAEEKRRKIRNIRLFIILILIAIFSYVGTIYQFTSAS